jgi:hypothetical protein
VLSTVALETLSTPSSSLHATSHVRYYMGRFSYPAQLVNRHTEALREHRAVRLLEA